MQNIGNMGNMGIIKKRVNSKKTCGQSIKSDVSKIAKGRWMWGSGEN